MGDVFTLIISFFTIVIVIILVVAVLVIALVAIESIVRFIRFIRLILLRFIFLGLFFIGFGLVYLAITIFVILGGKVGYILFAGRIVSGLIGSSRTLSITCLCQNRIRSSRDTIHGLVMGTEKKQAETERGYYQGSPESQPSFPNFVSVCFTSVSHDVHLFDAYLRSLRTIV